MSMHYVAPGPGMRTIGGGGFSAGSAGGLVMNGGVGSAANGSGGGLFLGGNTSKANMGGSGVHIGGVVQESGCCGPVHGSNLRVGGGPMGSGVRASGYPGSRSLVGLRPAGGRVILEPNSGCGCGTPADDTSCCFGGPGVSCGGVGEACCDGSGNMITTTDWTYVGEGGGDYSLGGYNYVGQGAGAYTKELIVTPYGCRLKPCCIIVSLLILLLPLLFFYLNQPQPAVAPRPVYVYTPVPTPWPAPRPMPPVTSPSSPASTPLPATRPPMPAPTVAPVPLGPIGICTIWGDPHVRTFDNMRADYYSPGEYWIVKSQNVWIQGRYLPTPATSGLSVTKILAVGGPFLKGHRLHASPTWTTWDGQRVLEAFPSDFSVPGLLEMHYNNVGELLQRGREGKPLHIVHIKIADGSPEGLLIQVNRWTEPSEGDYINVKITMHRQLDQDGHCGNFNGDPVDDDRLQVRARVGKNGVDPTQLLFHTKTLVVEANRPNINDCPAAALENAKALCKEREQKFIPSMACLVDVCFGGAAFAKEG